MRVFVYSYVECVHDCIYMSVCLKSCDCVLVSIFSYALSRHMYVCVLECVHVCRYMSVCLNSCVCTVSIFSYALSYHMYVCVLLNVYVSVLTCVFV